MIKLLHLLVSLVCVISKIRGNNLDDHHQPSSASSWKDAKDEPKIEFIDYKSPTISSSTESVYLYDSFDDVLQFKKNWIKSQSTKNHSTEYRYNGTWDLVVTHSRIRGDYGLRMKNKSRLHAISRKLDKKYDFTSNDFILQYDVQFRNGLDCGGAYIKLLSWPCNNLSQLSDQTPYTIMFGPDKCGNDPKMHFIFTHKNVQNGHLREIHWKKSNSVYQLSDIISDAKWHLLRLHLRPDNSFEISLDKRLVGSGYLLQDFTPAINSDQEIETNQDKPEDWDDREFIPDPDDEKPNDWIDENEMIINSSARIPNGWLTDEPPEIPDPEIKKPHNWSEEVDGLWQAPLIANPVCKHAPGCGQWSPPLIDNPNYKGKWTPRMIENPNYQGKWLPIKVKNPHYYEDEHPFRMQSIDAVAFELWTLNDAIIFDNILITSSLEMADKISESTYQLKRELNDADADNWFKNLIKITNKKPWLWAIYIIVIAVPLILFIGFCCVSPNSSSSSSNSTDYCKKKINHPFIYETYQHFNNDSYPTTSKDTYSSANNDDDNHYYSQSTTNHHHHHHNEYTASCSTQSYSSCDYSFDFFNRKVLPNIQEDYDDELYDDDDHFEIDDDHTYGAANEPEDDCEKHLFDQQHNEEEEAINSELNFQHEKIAHHLDTSKFVEDNEISAEPETETASHEIVITQESAEKIDTIEPVFDGTDKIEDNQNHDYNDYENIEQKEEECKKLIPEKALRRRRRHQNSKNKNGKNRQKKSKARRE